MNKKITIDLNRYEELIEIEQKYKQVEEFVNEYKFKATVYEDGSYEITKEMINPKNKVPKWKINIKKLKNSL